MKCKINLHMWAVIAAAALWGTAGIFVRTAEKFSLGEMQLVLLRAVFSSVILAAVILIKDRSLLKIKLKDLWLFISAGIMSIVLFNFCYYKTMALTSLSVAAVLLYTAPFFVVIISPFVFKTSLNLKKIVALIVAFFGCMLVSGAIGTGEKITAAALAFGILTGFGYSLYTVFSRLLLDRGYSSITITFYTFLFAALGCIPFTDFSVGYYAFKANPEVLFTGLLMAVFNTVVPYLLYTAGLKGVDPSAAPIMAMIEPVVATLVGVLIYKEVLTLSGAFGMALVFASVALLNVKFILKCRANAKINLALSVLGKRDDGYHELDTVMQGISLYDTLYITKSKKNTVICKGLNGEDNIVYRAAELFFKETDIIGGAKIKIKKHIPELAGLGGGSADAAAVLNALNDIYGAGLSDERLISLAVRLGADVPFLIKGGTARARGIGEILTPLKPFSGVYFIIAKGDEKPSTGEMFKRLDSTEYIKPDIEAVINAINNCDIKLSAELFENSFYTLWQNTKTEAELLKTNAVKVSLSGSGSAFFGVYLNKKDAKKALKNFKNSGIEVYLCKPIGSHSKGD